MKSIDECVCPKCKSKLMFTQSILKPNSLKYVLTCAWCYWQSKEYNFEKEAIENYETEIF